MRTAKSSYRRSSSSQIIFGGTTQCSVKRRSLWTCKASSAQKHPMLPLRDAGATMVFLLSDFRRKKKEGMGWIGGVASGRVSVIPLWDLVLCLLTRTRRIIVHTWVSLINRCDGSERFVPLKTERPFSKCQGREVHSNGIDELRLRPWWLDSMKNSGKCQGWMPLACILLNSPIPSDPRSALDCDIARSIHTATTMIRLPLPSQSSSP